MTSLQGLSEDYLSTHDDGGGVAGVGVHVAHARDVVVESGVIIHHVLGGRLLGLASETLIIEIVLNRTHVMSRYYLYCLFNILN